MYHVTVPLKMPGSAEYASFTTYFPALSPELPNITKRPTVVVCPGGGYAFTSDREAEPIALKLVSEGFNAVVMRYSVAPAHYPTALLEVAGAVWFIRERGAQYGCDPEKVFVLGFSAGGHLAASYGDFWSEDFVAQTLGVEKEILRPNGQVLCYPVITSGEFAHHDSIKNLLGAEYEEKCGSVSLENFVSENTPPTFLWHTQADDLVPVENTLLLARALQKHHIKTELHIYPDGGHGLSLCGDTTSWAPDQIMPRVGAWFENAVAFLKSL